MIIVSDKEALNNFIFECEIWAFTKTSGFLKKFRLLNSLEVSSEHKRLISVLSK
jgi:hypothetical protein